MFWSGLLSAGTISAAVVAAPCAARPRRWRRPGQELQDAVHRQGHLAWTGPEPKNPRALRPLVGSGRAIRHCLQRRSADPRRFQVFAGPGQWLDRPLHHAGDRSVLGRAEDASKYPLSTARGRLLRADHAGLPLGGSPRSGSPRRDCDNGEGASKRPRLFFPRLKEKRTGSTVTKVARARVSCCDDFRIVPRADAAALDEPTRDSRNVICQSGGRGRK